MWLGVGSAGLGWAVCGLVRIPMDETLGKCQSVVVVVVFKSEDLPI